MSALENALAAPAASDGERWAQRVQAAAVELAGDFRQHVDITEAPDGLYREVLKTSPRLSGAVDSLTREHVLIRGQVDSLLARVAGSEVIVDVDMVRDLGTALLGRLVRHRQRGSAVIPGESFRRLRTRPWTSGVERSGLVSARPCARSCWRQAGRAEPGRRVR